MPKTLDPGYAQQIADAVNVTLANMPDATAAAGAFLFNEDFGRALDLGAQRAYGETDWLIAKAEVRAAISIGTDDESTDD